MGPNDSLDVSDIPCDSGRCDRASLEGAVFEREQQISTLELRANIAEQRIRELEAELECHEHEIDGQRMRADKAEAERDGLREALQEIDDIIRNSTGVVGLHLNGDVAEWDSLLATGRLEEWLGSLDAALKDTP